MNNMIFAVLIISLAVAALFFSLFLKSASWTEVQGKVVHFQVKDSYLSTNSVSSSNRNLFNYEIDVKYQYSFNGLKYTGNKLVAGMPNVTSDRKIADQLSIDYAVGKTVSVYVDAKAPENSSLQTAKSFGWKGILMVGFLLIVAGLFVYGVMYFRKLMMSE